MKNYQKAFLLTFLCISLVWAENNATQNDSIEDEKVEINFTDRTNDGFNEDGSCSGDVLIFNGTSHQCRAWSFYGLGNSNCCAGTAYTSTFDKCSEQEQDLQKKKMQGKCLYTSGEFCTETKCMLPFLGKCQWRQCIKKDKTACCFNSKIARIIHQQGRPQIKRGWGSATSPDCRGFTQEEFAKLDFSKIDLSEYIDDVQSKINIEGIDTGDVEQRIKDKIDKFY